MKGAAVFAAALAVLASCTFDYGGAEEDTAGRPDLVMDNVEYVRVRNGDPQVRFFAEKAERYEQTQRMRLDHFTFEQFDNHGEDVNASGRAGEAAVELESGNIDLDGGVSISVKSEDFTVETRKLHWNDKEHVLTAEEQAVVNIYREDGTEFSGRGFSADARRRTWEFAEGLSGTYVHEDDEDAEASEEATPVSEDTPVGETGEAVAEKQDVGMSNTDDGMSEAAE